MTPDDDFRELDSAELDEVSGGRGAVLSGSGGPSTEFTAFTSFTGMVSIGGNGIHAQSLATSQAPGDTPLVQTFGSNLSDTQGSQLGGASTVDQSNYFDRNPWAAQADPDGSQPNDGTQSTDTQPAQPGGQDASASNPDSPQDATQSDYFDREPWAAQADPDGTQGDSDSTGQGSGGGDGGGGDGGDGG